MVHAGKKKNNNADRNYNQAHYDIMTMDRHIDGRVDTDRQAVITQYINLGIFGAAAAAAAAIDCVESTTRWKLYTVCVTSQVLP